jgi:HEPN domain-containing protein
MIGRPPPETPLAWLDRARSDLALGNAALNTPGVYVEDACFHAQQGAEKALKALLISRRMAFPRTHAIELLLDFLRAAGVYLPPEVDGAFVLSQYAVETRYPGVWEPITNEEALVALQTAAQVIVWVEAQL